MSESLRVLILEDNPDHVQLEREALLDAYPDCMIESGGTLAEVDRLLASGPYTIAFVDYHLTNCTGLEVLALMTERQVDMPVVMVTAMGDRALAIHALRSGASDYLFKTAEFFNQLPRMVQTNLERHRLRRERDRLLHETEEHAKRVSLVNYITSAIRETLELDSLLRTLTETCCRTLGLSRAVVVQCADDWKKIVRVAGHAQPGYSLPEQELRTAIAGLPEVQRAAESMGTQVLDSASDRSPQPGAMGTYAAVYSPVVHSSQLLGVLVLQQCDGPRTWTQGEIQLIREVTGQLAVAIRQGQLFEALSRANTFWDRTFDSMTDAVTVHDVDGTIVHANVAARKMSATTELVRREPGQSCCMLAYPMRHTPEECLCLAAIRGQRTLMSEVQDERRRTLRISVDPLIDDNRSLLGAVMVSRDITEQRKMQENLLESKKLRALGELASGVAHDFNNILTVILGRAQMMQSRLTDDANKRTLDVIITAAKDGGRTIQRIQDFTRVRADHKFSKVDLSTLIHETIEITSSRWKDEAHLTGRHIELEVDTPRKVWVLGDAAELREVFVNLIFNSLDAMPSGGTLQINLGEISGRAIVKFHDSGVGMPVEVIDRIFDPFFTTKGLSGMGLGLSISHNIVTGHGGAIEVESRPGFGTCFTVTLPAVGADLTLTVEPQPREWIPAKVLVVDDEKEVRDLLHDLLASAGHTVKAVEDGPTALAILEQDDFDLVLTDLGMPVMSGWEVAEAIKRKDPTLPVGLVTGWGGVVQRQDLEQRGIDLLITKPFDVREVLTIIGDAVESRRRRATHA